MKIIDKFLIKAFIGPFVVSFGIALFVLVMQVLWVYIDEIMGKGLSIFDITELIFYLSMTLVPMALPIAVLISSVMVTGNMAERYELSSFKSAGIGLVRVLRPLVVAVGFITLSSIFIAEKVIPWANLKFYSRFYDIRKSKPTLALQEGIFNDEFQDYTIRIGKKGTDGRSLDNVMIYNNRSSNQLIDQTIAQKGEMYTTANKEYIVMNLYDGIQFKEQNNAASKQTYPFVRIKFKSWEKVFDLSEFEKKKTDEDLFKNHQKMKNSAQLLHFADSIKKDGVRYIQDMKGNIQNNFTIMRNARKLDIPPTSAGVTPKVDSVKVSADSAKVDSTTAIADTANKITPANKKMAQASTTLVNTPYATKAVVMPGDTASIKKLPRYFYDYESNIPPYERNSFANNAETKTRTIVTSAENAINSLNMVNVAAGKFIYEMNMKYNYAFICLVFLFIGAPMGAIIQKGGFGMPILVAIVFFMFYMVSNIYCKNLKESQDLGYILAAWLPVFIMIPIAGLLTYRALNDYKLLNFDPLKFFKNLKIPKFKRKAKV